MNIIQANIVELWAQGNVVCVTTNGFVKKSGEAVMGRGNALAMAQAIPELPLLLGNFIKKYTNRVGFIYAKSVINFPVKPSYGNYNDLLTHIQKRHNRTDTKIPGFWCKAQPSIIEKSISQLNDLIIKFNLEKVYLPIPGVNNGQLKYQDIKPILEKVSDKVTYCVL